MSLAICGSSCRGIASAKNHITRKVYKELLPGVGMSFYSGSHFLSAGRRVDCKAQACQTYDLQAYPAYAPHCKSELLFPWVESMCIRCFRHLRLWCVVRGFGKHRLLRIQIEGECKLIACCVLLYAFRATLYSAHHTTAFAI